MICFLPILPSLHLQTELNSPLIVARVGLARSGGHCDSAVLSFFGAANDSLHLFLTFLKDVIEHQGLPVWQETVKCCGPYLAN